MNLAGMIVVLDIRGLYIVFRTRYNIKDKETMTSQ